MQVKPIKSLEKIEQMKNELEKCKNLKAERMFVEKKRNRTLFCFGINSALRISDICNLDLKDVFQEDLSFRSIIGATEQKTKKNKEFPLTDSLQDELKKYICVYLSIWYKIVIIDVKDYNNLSTENKEKIKEIINTKPLFPSERNLDQYISRYQVYRILNTAGEKCGLENIGTHTMRKTFGYWFYQRTKDIAMLQKLLNHANQSETMIYIRHGARGNKQGLYEL